MVNLLANGLVGTGCFQNLVLLVNRMNKIGMLSGAVVPLRILSTGAVIWMAPITMNTICEVDVQKYPFDRQECLVELATWGYSTVRSHS